MKMIGKLLVVAIVLVVVLVFAVGWFGGSILKTGVEKGGTWALGSPTELGSASLSLLGGAVSLEQLNIHNPEGFKADSALKVGQIDVKANVGSFLSDTIVIEHIDIAAPEVTLEVGTGGSNIGALMEYLEAKTGGEGQPAAEPEEESGAPAKKLRVDRVTITSPQVRLVQSVLLKTEQVIPLPTLELTDIGGGEDGGEQRDVTLPELIEEIFGTILAAAAQSGKLPAELKAILDNEVTRFAAEFAGKIKDQLAGSLGDAAGIIGDLGGGAAEQLGDVGDGAKKTVGGAADKLKEGLGGLLGGGDEKKEKK